MEGISARVKSSSRIKPATTCFVGMTAALAAAVVPHAYSIASRSGFLDLLSLARKQMPSPGQALGSVSLVVGQGVSPVLVVISTLLWVTVLGLMAWATLSLRSPKILRPKPTPIALGAPVVAVVFLVGASTGAIRAAMATEARQGNGINPLQKTRPHRATLLPEVLWRELGSGPPGGGSRLV